jgi:hypothetical protein
MRGKATLITATTFYEAWNKPEKAEEWREKLPKIEAQRE